MSEFKYGELKDDDMYGKMLMVSKQPKLDYEPQRELYWTCPSCGWKVWRYHQFYVEQELEAMEKPEVRVEVHEFYSHGIPYFQFK